MNNFISEYMLFNFFINLSVIIINKYHFLIVHYSLISLFQFNSSKN